MAMITLITDFGTQDEYVGVMKGVILSIDPSATIVDISHQVAPQDLHQAAHMLQAAVPYFPKGTVHIVVVDPGVGGDRDILAVKAGERIFLGPDNGVLTPVFQHLPIENIVRVENPQYFLPSVSRTFHGRDIFAPVGAHVAGGISIRDLGPALPTDRPVRLQIRKPVVSNRGDLLAMIAAEDRFGNLVTNVDRRAVDAFCKGEPVSQIAVHVGNSVIYGIVECYGNVASGQPAVMIGSRGFLEIAINGGHAASHFGVRSGDSIRLSIGRSDRCGHADGGQKGFPGP